MNAAELKAAIPPVDFYRVELPGMPPPRRDHGWVDGGLCPFHPDTRRGNFRVNLDTGQYVCFACGAKGPDIINFVQRRHAVCFRDALQMLAAAWGVCV